MDIGGVPVAGSGSPASAVSVKVQTSATDQQEAVAAIILSGIAATTPSVGSGGRLLAVA